MGVTFIRRNKVAISCDSCRIYLFHQFRTKVLNWSMSYSNPICTYFIPPSYTSVAYVHDP